jgi:hypothetical protein
MTGSPLRRLRELASGTARRLSHVRRVRRRRNRRAVRDSAIDTRAHTTLDRVRKRGKRRLAVAMTLVGCLLMGCSAGSSSDSSPAPPVVSPAGLPSVRVDGVTLAALGYLNGPIEQFSLPRTAVITAKVDQPNNVAVVLSSPSPAEVATYLRQALPAAGFTITAEDAAAKTMTFAGNGWIGNFTGDSRASAVLLRPQ